LQSEPISGDDEGVQISHPRLKPVLLRPATGGFSFC
jgi:hypothetical protein